VKKDKSIELPANQRLFIENSQETSELTIVDADGRVNLSVTITPEGPVLHLTGGSLMLHTDGDLGINAKQIDLHGREGVSLSTDGDLNVHAQGEVAIAAKKQSITAELGNVDIKANDDVQLDGERIKMNC